jgi:hypothetical protein
MRPYASNERHHHMLKLLKAKERIEEFLHHFR